MALMDVVLEHTRLVKEYVMLPKDAESAEAYEPISKRKKEILQRIEELREEERRAKHGKGIC